jgi:hypothetical protein
MDWYGHTLNTPCDILTVPNEHLQHSKSVVFSGKSINLDIGKCLVIGCKNLRTL